MKPLPSLFLAAAMLIGGAPPARAQPSGSPVNDLAKRLAEDPQERAAAGKRVESFLLDADASRRRFVTDDADHAALGAVARDWAGKVEPRRLAILLVVAAPDSRTEGRLRRAQARWIGRLSSKDSAHAFLLESAAAAEKILADPAAAAEIDDAIRVNDESAPAVPGVRESVERARAIKRPGAGADVFGDAKKTPGEIKNAEPGKISTWREYANWSSIKHVWSGDWSSPPPGKRLDSIDVPSPGGAETIEKNPATRSFLKYLSADIMDGAMLNPLMFMMPMGVSRPVAPAARASSVTRAARSAALLDFAPAERSAGAVVMVRKISDADVKASSQGYLEGVIDFQKGDYEKAAEKWRKAKQLDPSNADAAAGLEKLEKLKAPVK